MGQIIKLIPLHGQCPQCSKTINGYGRSPGDAVDRLCPCCHQLLRLRAYYPVPAWELENGGCLLLEAEPLHPPDVMQHERREELIRMLGLGRAAALGIHSDILPHGLVKLRIAVGTCYCCFQNRDALYLTTWQKRRTICTHCNRVLYFPSERTIVTAHDGNDFWPLLSESMEVVRVFNRDDMTEDLTLVQTWTELDLELLGLR
jgi:hypothetical protein